MSLFLGPESIAFIKDRIEKELTLCRTVAEKYLDYILPSTNEIEIYRSIETEYDCIAGIDGSISRPLVLGPALLALVSAVGIVIDANDRKSSVFGPRIEVEVEIDKGDPEIVKRILEIKMFRLEVDMLQKVIERLRSCCSKSIVFIDGPIVDPPSVPDIVKQRRDYREYLKLRVNTIANGLDSGIDIVGVVKRIRGTSITNYLRKTARDSVPECRDDIVIVNAFSLLKSALNGVLDDYILITKVMEIEVPEYREYVDLGLRVYSFFTSLTKDKIRIIRMDIPIVNKDSAEEDRILSKAISIISSIRDWSSNSSGIPLIIDLAHRYCTIPQDTMKKIFSGIIHEVLGDLIDRVEDIDTYLDEILG